MVSSRRGSRVRRCCTANQRLKRNGLNSATAAISSKETGGQHDQENARRLWDTRGDIAAGTGAETRPIVAAPKQVVLRRAIRLPPDHIVGHVDFAVAVEVAVQAEAGDAENDVVRVV